MKVTNKWNIVKSSKTSKMCEMQRRKWMRLASKALDSRGLFYCVTNVPQI
jgi:hypothetical protein